MHGLLADEGIEHRSRGGPRRLLERMVELGGGSMFRRRVASWPVVHRPRDGLDAWHSKSGLAGVELEPALQTRVLDQLEVWALEQFGDLDREHPSEEHYELHGVLVPPESY
jgi:hypothetical protein